MSNTVTLTRTELADMLQEARDQALREVTAILDRKHAAPPAPSRAKAHWRRK